MQDITSSHSATEVSGGDLADVTKLPLPELVASEDTVLHIAMRRVLAELDDPREVVAGFQNYQP